MANNPALYNAVIAGATGATQERWLTNNNSVAYDAFRTQILLIADAVDGLVATISGGPSIGTINLMQSVTYGIFSTRFPSVSNFTQIAGVIVALWQNLSAGLDITASADLSSSRIENLSGVDGATVTDALNTLLTSGGSYFRERFAGGIIGSFALADMPIIGQVGQNGLSYSTNGNADGRLTFFPVGGLYAAGEGTLLELHTNISGNPHRVSLFWGEANSQLIEPRSLDSLSAIFDTNMTGVGGVTEAVSFGFGPDIETAVFTGANSAQWYYEKGVNSNNWLFRTYNSGGFLEETPTNIPGVISQLEHFEIRQSEDGLSWEGYYDEVLRASHSNFIPSPTANVNAGIRIICGGATRDLYMNDLQLTPRVLS